MSSTSAFPSPSLAILATRIASLLNSRKETVAVAETAAGGLISAALLSVPGASAYYRGGLTLYTLQSRIAFSHWSEENLKGYSGPTPEIVAGLVRDARQKLDSTYAIGESGTAGPTRGPARNATAGYVALAIASKSGQVSKDLNTGVEDRAQNMVLFAEEALKLLLDVLEGNVAISGSSL